MILRIFVIVVVLIAALLAFAATKPNTFSIQRSRSIQAPPEKIFALINDFHNWSQWAPQDKEDSTMKRAFSGAKNGAGAVSDWESSGSAGKGRMTITESVPSKKVSVKVDFVRPFEAHNVNEFTLESGGTSTIVTWSMHGTNLYMMKLMSIFVNMDRMAGKHFEDGLDNLKAIAEK
ncbi:MAG: SRPBCC family protein [Terriglobales bacterium]|jgi:uncharacterized protein YndB with AHSA1/START domain